MRVLGIDPGSKRVGIALSDEDGIIASPHGTVSGDAREAAAREVAELARTHEVGRIVVGLPLRLDGSEGEATRRARWFAERLHALTSLPIELWDERFTSKAAERSLRSAGVRGAKQRQSVDRVAAALLLQSFLDAQRYAGGVSESDEPYADEPHDEP